MPERPPATRDRERRLFRPGRTPLSRIQNGAFVLVCIFAFAVVGFHLLGEYDWIEAIWMTTVTISTVGFAERSSAEWYLQLFSVVVIVLGVSAGAYTFGGFVQMVLEGELDTMMGHRRMTRGIGDLTEHVIICGFGRIGEVLAMDLRRSDKPCVVVDHDPDRFEAAKAAEFLCVYGDATQEDTLKRAGIENAASLVSCLPSDADNVFITLTARNLNTTIQILARAEHQTTEPKLIQAGADKVIMPTIIGAHRMERMITRPSTAHLMELVTETSFMDLELDEVKVDEGSKLLGAKVGQTEAHRKHGLLVVEDAAQGIDAKLDGRWLGTIAPLGAVSFHETKNIHCGLGGALFVNDPDLFDPAYRRYLTNRFRDTYPVREVPVVFHFRRRDRKSLQQLKGGG